MAQPGALPRDVHGGAGRRPTGGRRWWRDGLAGAGRPSGQARAGFGAAWPVPAGPSGQARAGFGAACPLTGSYWLHGTSLRPRYSAISGRRSSVGSLVIASQRCSRATYQRHCGQCSGRKGIRGAAWNTLQSFPGDRRSPGREGRPWAPSDGGGGPNGGMVTGGRPASRGPNVPEVARPRPAIVRRPPATGRVDRRPPRGRARRRTCHARSRGDPAPRYPAGGPPPAPPP